MKILILNWRDIRHPLSGGAEISLSEHAKYWIEKHNAKVLWFSSGFEGAKREEKVDGIQIVRRGSQYTVHLHAFFYILTKLKKEVDIIIDSFHFVPFFTPLYIGRKTIIALINEPAKKVWFKNINIALALIGYFIEPLFFIPYRKKIFLTGSDSIAGELLEYKIPQGQIRVVHHGVSIVRPKNKTKNKENPIILFLAKIVEDKGIEDALKMFSIVNKTFPKAKLWVVGSPASQDYQKKIIQIVNKLKLNEEVKFFGFVSESEKYKILQKTSILVHPSIREGWGLTIIEAASFGVPAVGYNVSGLKDSIRDGETGLLAKKNTPEDLANCVFSLLRDKKMYGTLSRNAMTYAKTFSWTSSGNRSWSIIKKTYDESQNK